MRKAVDAGARRWRSATWLQRHAGMLVGGTVLALGGALAAAGLLGGASWALAVLIFISAPVASLASGALGPWPSVVLGLCVNAFALGFVAHSLARFSSGAEGMTDLAVRILGRDRT